MNKKFDLNIEKILEDWEVYHAIREVVANAIDEQIITKTKEIKIYKDSQERWHIRDFGRGLNYQHLTQKEDDEKLENPNVIGKFGIGLKDAFATFDRKDVKILVKSKHGEITLDRTQKHEFDDLITLHACISPSSEPDLVGTDFILEGLTDKDVDKAKDLFLKFSGEKVLETTQYGQVLKKKNNTGRIYINGVRVAEEENFLFSYNITSLTSSIRKALNRERTNVGRSAYSDRVKSIILSCAENEVAKRLIEDLKEYQTGEMHDEVKWLDVQQHAVKILNATEKVVFFTADDLVYSKNMVDEAQSSGYTVITIPENLKQKIHGLKDISGRPILDMDHFFSEYTSSFKFKFIKIDELNPSERKIYNKTKKILEIAGKPKKVKNVKISTTMKKDMSSFIEATGVWEESTGTIIIKRTQLKTIEKYSGTLLHEVAHALSGASDVSREFENELSKLLGTIAPKVLTSL
ncbi:MAG: ATP-binding protein [Candidatus Bathyarchaeia archaeon]